MAEDTFGNLEETHTHKEGSPIFIYWHEVLFGPFINFSFLVPHPTPQVGLVVAAYFIHNRSFLQAIICAVPALQLAHTARFFRQNVAVSFVVENIWKAAATQARLSYHKCNIDAIFLLLPLVDFIAVLKRLWILQNVELLW